MSSPLFPTHLIYGGLPLILTEARQGLWEQVGEDNSEGQKRPHQNVMPAIVTVLKLTLNIFWPGQEKLHCPYNYNIHSSFYCLPEVNYRYLQKPDRCTPSMCVSFWKLPRCCPVVSAEASGWSWCNWVSLTYGVLNKVLLKADVLTQLAASEHLKEVLLRERCTEGNPVAICGHTRPHHAASALSSPTEVTDVGIPHTEQNHN